MAFRASVRRALAAPVGGSLASRFGAAAVTAILADGEGGERDGVALAELIDALAHAGVPRGRQFVLLTGVAAPDEARRVRARELHATLGTPVLVHDSGATAVFDAGALAPAFRLELDDELREAEAVVACGRFDVTRDGMLRGGPAALLPGAASDLARLRLRQRLCEWGEEPALRTAGHLTFARAAMALVPVDFALLWSADDPPRVLAGGGTDVLAACERDGWLVPRPEAEGHGP